MVVILEGLDAVGKTTLAKLLAKKVGGVYYKTPPKSFRSKCRQIDSNGVIYTEARFNLYIESVVCVSDIIQNLLQINHQKVFVIDRWIWTTLAYHFGFNYQLYDKWMNNYQDITSKILKPDLNILLYIPDEQIWLKRIGKRGIDNPDRLIVDNTKIRNKIHQLYRNLNPDFCLVDNSGDIDNSLQHILNLLP